MSTIGKVIFWVVVVVAGALMVFHGGKVEYRRGYNDALASIKPDTEYVDKPVYIDRPVPVEIKPAGQEFYPVGTLAQLQHVIDSLAAVKPDTTMIEIPVPMETKIYRDEKDSTYTAQITGYNASLDWIIVHQRTAYINTPIPTPAYPKFILSPAITAEVLPGSAFVGTGLEAQWNRGRWGFSVEPGYGANFLPDGIKHGPYVFGKTKFNLIRR